MRTVFSAYVWCVVIYIVENCILENWEKGRNDYKRMNSQMYIVFNLQKYIMNNYKSYIFNYRTNPATRYTRYRVFYVYVLPFNPYLLLFRKEII